MRPDAPMRSRRLTLFYKFVNNLCPEYTVDPIPPLHQSQYRLCDQDVIGRLRARTDKFKSSFYPNCLSEWNNTKETWKTINQLVNKRSKTTQILSLKDGEHTISKPQDIAETMN